MSETKKTEASESAMVPPAMATDRPAEPTKPVADAKPPAGGADTKKPAVLPTYLTPQQPEVSVSPDGTVTVLVSAADNGGGFGMVEITSPPFTGASAQIHSQEDQTFYVITGNGEFRLGEQKLICTAGSCIFVPRGTVSGYRSVGTAPLRVLIVYTPGGFEQIYRDMAKAGIHLGSAGMREMFKQYQVTHVPG